MTTIKNYRSKETITITATDYANSDNQGVLLGKTLRPIKTEWINGKRISFIWQDVNSSELFITSAVDGKMAIKNTEFARCTMWRGFNNDGPAEYTKLNWTKSHPTCLEYKINK